MIFSRVRSCSSILIFLTVLWVRILLFFKEFMSIPTFGEASYKGFNITNEVTMFFSKTICNLTTRYYDLIVTEFYNDKKGKNLVAQF